LFVKCPSYPQIIHFSTGANNKNILIIFFCFFSFESGKVVENSQIKKSRGIVGLPTPAISNHGFFYARLSLHLPRRGLLGRKNGLDIGF